MKRAFNILYIVLIVLSLMLLFYLALPLYGFPPELPDSIKSQEPADLEDTNRRGYFTDLERSDVIAFYLSNFGSQKVLVKLPVLRANYPPEEAQEKVRDQTASTFLEEIVYPFRDSLFINGYMPKPEQPKLEVDGKAWKQKIIVKYVPSNVFVRLGVGSVTLVFLYILLINWKQLFTNLKEVLWPKK